MKGLRLDHTGLAVKDLDSGRAAFERLGFRLTSRSMHAGSPEPGAPVIPWGSGNHCAMFRDGYFEVLGLVDAEKHSSVKHMVKRYEGLHIVALECEDASAAHTALEAAGVHANRPAALERDAAFGSDNEQIRRAKFSNIYLDSDKHPEARFIVIQHHTPEVLWQPHLLTHPNGAVGLRAIYFASPDVEATAERFARLLGPGAPLGASLKFSTDRGALVVMSEADTREAIPVLREGPVHRVSAATIAVQSLSELKSFFDARGIAHVHAAALDGRTDSVWVAPQDASHAALQFIDSKATIF